MVSAVFSAPVIAVRPVAAARATRQAKASVAIKGSFLGSTNAFAVAPAARAASRSLVVKAEKSKSPLEDLEIPEAIDTFVDDAKEVWDRQEDKPAVAALGAFGLVGIFAVSKVLDSVDNLPVLPGFFELVGILYSGWFIYRFLLFKPDRAELKAKVDELTDKIID